MVVSEFPLPMPAAASVHTTKSYFESISFKINMISISVDVKYLYKKVLKIQNLSFPALPCIHSLSKGFFFPRRNMILNSEFAQPNPPIPCIHSYSKVRKYFYRNRIENLRFANPLHDMCTVRIHILNLSIETFDRFISSQCSECVCG